MQPITLESVRQFIIAPLFYLGQTPVTLGGVGSAVLVVFASFFISSLVQRSVMTRLTGRLKLESGMLYALGRILHYAIIVMGVILASQCVGLNLGSLAVLFGFLSVGIGFGLQNVTSNFISGIIVLLERPISVGDMVSVEDKVGTVTDIRIRSTVINTGDNVSIIVPNSKFIENQVTNWSYDDPRVRVRCAVGVAYGTNAQLVKKTLLDVAASHPEVLKNPAPEVRFRTFGASSLDFELFAWTGRPEIQFRLQSDINFLIDEAFRKAGISIPFSQSDIYLQMSPAVDKIAEALRGGEDKPASKPESRA